MCITSSLIGIEGESLINVVIDGILRPKTGYTVLTTVLSKKPARELGKQNAPWRENELAYRPYHGPLQVSRDRPTVTFHWHPTTHQFNETALPDLYVRYKQAIRHQTPSRTQRTGFPLAQLSPRHPLSID